MYTQCTQAVRYTGCCNHAQAGFKFIFKLYKFKLFYNDILDSRKVIHLMNKALLHCSIIFERHL